MKLKLVTDTYILQDKRSRLQGQNQNALCYLCSEAHFILQCKVLESIRQSVISEIDSVCLAQYNRSFYAHPVPLQLQFILDVSKVHEEQYRYLATDHLSDIEYQSHRLSYLLERDNAY